MISFLLFALFFVLFASRTLGFDLSLAPGLSVKNAFLYVLFAGLAIDAVVTRRYKLELFSVLVPFLLYTTYAIFTWLLILLILDYPGYSLRATAISLKSGPVEHFLVLLMFFFGTRDAQQGLRLLKAMIWLVIVGNIVSVVDALNIPDLGLIDEREDGRIGGTIGNSNEFAAFLALFLPAILVVYWNEHGLKRALAGIGLLVSGLAFLMALSRGALLGLAAGGIVGAWYLRASIPSGTVVRTAIGTLFVSLAITLIGFLAGYGELVTERFGQFAANPEVASSGRTVIWSQALESMAENPLSFITGYGWYAYESANFRYATHNSYLNMIYNIGLIGLGLFLLASVNILRIARTGLRHATGEARYFLMAFLFGFLALLATIFFGELYTAWLYVWAFVGVSLRLAVAATSAAPEAALVGTRPRGIAGRAATSPGSVRGISSATGRAGSLQRWARSGHRE